MAKMEAFAKKGVQDAKTPNRTFFADQPLCHRPRDLSLARLSPTFLSGKMGYVEALLRIEAS